MIEQLKSVKRNQSDIIECLCDIDDDMITFNDELKDIKRSIQNIDLFNPNRNR